MEAWRLNLEDTLDRVNQSRKEDLPNIEQIATPLEDCCHAVLNLFSSYGNNPDRLDEFEVRFARDETERAKSLATLLRAYQESREARRQGRLN